LLAENLEKTAKQDLQCLFYRMMKSGRFIDFAIPGVTNRRILACWVQITILSFGIKGW
jgi:hypothetical protein